MVYFHFDLAGNVNTTLTVYLVYLYDLFDGNKIHINSVNVKVLNTSADKAKVLILFVLSITIHTTIDSLITYDTDSLSFPRI